MRRRLLLACACAAWSTWACPAPSTSTPPTSPSTPAKKATIGLTSEPASLCPLFADGGATAEVQALLFRELVQQRLTGVEPDLAVRVPRFGDGAVIDDHHRLVVDWELRADAHWSDGTPVTARDVVAGYVVAKDGAGVVASRDLIAGVSAVDVVDDHHVRVTWATPSPNFASPRIHRVLPAHLVLNADGTPKDLTKDGWCNKAGVVVGDGPFRLVEWQPGAFLRFAKDPRATPAAQLDEVVVRVVPSTEALISGLVAGDIDTTLANGGLTPSEAARAVDAGHGRLVSASAPGTVWIHLDYNLDDAVLADVRVRRALAHALDRAALAAIAGGVDLADSFLPPQHWAHASQELPAYDPARAAALLDDAGFQIHPGERVRRRQQQPLHLELMAASGNADTERMLQAAQAMWAAVGVDVALDLKPWKVFFGEFAKKRKVKQLSVYTWTLDESSVGTNLWRSQAIPAQANSFQGQNLPGWRNVVVDDALARAEVELDPARRRALLADVQRAFATDLPALPFWFRRAVTVHNAALAGPTPTGTLSPTTSTAATWTWTTPPATPQTGGG